MEEALVKKSTAKNDTRIDGKDVNLGSSVTPFLLFSTLVAGFACVTFGCATGYSSAAEAGIVADMGLSTAQILKN
nr:PREDICTED: sugar transporter ERD6-like 3 [Daucus carota subsp. sativus]